MEKMKTIIVDDEKNSLEVLQNLVGEYCSSLEVVAVFQDPRLALDFILKNEIDLLFLDINMPFMTGLELLKKVPAVNFSVIFTTAFDQYAIEAIRLAAADYLLKPIDVSELVTAVERVRGSVSKIQEQEKNNNEGNYTSNRLLIHQLNNVIFINHDDILYLKADNNYTGIITAKRKVVASKTIKFFEGQLPSSKFYRCHQSYIVNLDYMTEYSKSDQTIVMKDGTMIPLSKNKKEGLFKLLM